MKHDIEWKVKEAMLEKFMTELKASGYSEKDRLQILKSGIIRYEKLKKKEEENIRPFFRKRNFRRSERAEEKKSKKTD